VAGKPRLWHVNETPRQSGDWRSRTELLVHNKKSGRRAAALKMFRTLTW